MILMMIAEVLFFDIFFEKDSHLNAVEGGGGGGGGGGEGMKKNYSEIGA